MKIFLEIKTSNNNNNFGIYNQGRLYLSLRVSSELITYLATMCVNMYLVITRLLSKKEVIVEVLFRVTFGLCPFEVQAHYLGHKPQQDSV